MPPNIVVIVGPPGAGKSSQKAILTSELRTRGFKARTADLSSGRLLACLWPLVIAVAKLFTRQQSNVRPTRALLENRRDVFRALFRLWLMLDTFDVYAKFLFEIHLPFKSGYSVIIEQSPATIIANYLYVCRTLGLPSSATSPWAGLVQRLIHLSQPTRVVLLDAETEVLESRWKRRGRYRENIALTADTPQYLYMQRSLALSLVRSLHSCDPVCVDSSGTEGTTSKGVLGAVLDMFSESSRVQ